MEYKISIRNTITAKTISQSNELKITIEQAHFVPMTYTLGPFYVTGDSLGSF